MHISELDTPSLVIDLDIMEDNLHRVSEYTRKHNLRLRPHTKTHKIPDLGRRQLALGAAGLTVAKTTEAEVMLESGTSDLLIAYPIVGAKKLARVVELARKVQLTISVDSFEAARGVSEAAAAGGVSIGVLLELDVGLRRVGLEPERFLPGLKQIAALPGLTIQGASFYPGHIKAADAQGIDAMERVSTLLEQIVSESKAQGIELFIVSGGSTPTLWHSHRILPMNEIRPGTYIFNDRNTVLGGTCTLEECAAVVHCTVVSTSVPGQFILDGGSKTFSSDRSSAEGHGIVLEAPEAVFEKMNEEHGFVKLPNAQGRFKVGDRVRVVPNHVCVAVNLEDQVYGVRGDRVEQVFRVAGRGKLQ